jgi:hypothetical protein
MTCASRGDGVALLETTAASVVVGMLEILREKAGQECYSMHQGEGRRLGGSRGKGESWTASKSVMHGGSTYGLRRAIWAALRCLFRGEREEQEGECGGFIVEVFMTI